MLGEIAGVGIYQSKSKKGVKKLPFPFWTDLGYKEPPFVEVTEGGIFMLDKLEFIVYCFL